MTKFFAYMVMMVGVTVLAMSGVSPMTEANATPAARTSGINGASCIWTAPKGTIAFNLRNVSVVQIWQSTTIRITGVRDTYSVEYDNALSAQKAFENLTTIWAECQ